jgi:hypothetical protein
MPDLGSNCSWSGWSGVAFQVMSAQPSNLSIAEWFIATPEHLGSHVAYQAFCSDAGIPAVPEGYGLLFATDPLGVHWTLAGDPEYAKTLHAASKRGPTTVSLDLERFPYRLRGWPDEW